MLCPDDGVVGVKQCMPVTITHLRGSTRRLQRCQGRARVVRTSAVSGCPPGLTTLGRMSISASSSTKDSGFARLRRNDGLTDFGELIVESHDDTYAEFEITPAVTRSGFWPTIVMRKISDVYEQDPGKAMS